ncbi:MAG: RNA pseudouridine synthase [Bacteroidales bacterium]|nr:RNA pseudouridine synthase [Candidatus Sodaliphilus aphodohippi]
MTDKNPRFHPLDAKGVEMPDEFTNPFYYSPHPLCRMAAGQVMGHIGQHPQWQAELTGGKMLGVLVASNSDGQVGFLAAFSGNLCGSNDLPYFVPPICDLMDPDGEFKRGERAITAINHSISDLQSAAQLTSLRDKLEQAQQNMDEAIAAYKAMMTEHKRVRDQQRDAGTTPEQAERLLNESRFEKAELKRIRQRHQSTVDQCRDEVDNYLQHIDDLKKKRRQMSEDLQRRIFELYIVHNGNKKSSDLTKIFAQSTRTLPPAGTGECCAPKLLEYAYRNNLKPLCMAEFWYGQSPIGEIRRHGQYYPACRGKCKPILDFMLQGLIVESNPLEQPLLSKPLEVLYYDRWLTVVNKPSGMLSVPGKELEDSAMTRFMALFPEATGPIVVHRLDQETSGILVFAKDKDTHKALQQQFEQRTTAKRYIAVLDGTVGDDCGTISLPICPNVYDRPRQMVDDVNGKEAVTRYRVLERANGHTLIEFVPLTGRTHQLRVHAAHPLGLNAPITGDRLYGTASSRLMLHAASLTITHPHTGQPLTVDSPLPFSIP